jgi:plastocyanin
MASVMARAKLVLPAVAAAALMAPAAATAAEFNVAATPSNTFSPATLTIAVNDTVVWRNDGGLHNVKFDDGSFEQPSSPQPPALWPSRVSRTFASPGTFTYFCEEHSSGGGYGMAGTIVVQQAGGGGGPPPDTQAPTITRLRLGGSGHTLSAALYSSEAGTATLTFARRVAGRYRRVRRLERAVKAGRNPFRLRRTSRGRLLPAGRYRLSARVKDVAGNTGTSRRAYARLP